MKFALLVLFSLSLTNISHARPNSSDWEAGIVKKDPAAEAAERERLKQEFENRTQNAERAVLKEAIKVLVVQAKIATTFAANDFKNDSSKEMNLQYYRSGIDSDSNPYSLMASLSNEIDTSRVLNLKKDLEKKVATALFGLYKSETEALEARNYALKK